MPNALEVVTYCEDISLLLTIYGLFIVCKLISRWAGDLIMSFPNAPSIVCRLTDQYGTIISPFSPNAIQYTEKSWGQQRNLIRVCMEGYIAIFEGETRFSPPIPFCIVQNVSLFAPKRATITFSLKQFRYCIIPTYFGDQNALERVTVILEVESLATSYQNASLLSVSLPSCCRPVRQVWYEPKRALDSCYFLSHTELSYDALIRAKVCQYTALSDGVTRHYTNQDAVPEYKGCGILPPDCTSYYNLYVNGMLQPKVNYTISEGQLDFMTTDLPPKEVPIVLEFISFCSPNGQMLPVTTSNYVSVSNGRKRLYRNQDALPVYSEGGIPSPDSVSYYNLYSNGVLQPRTNYVVKEGLLELTSSDIPIEGSILILESVMVRNEIQQLLLGEVTQYHAKANPRNWYTNCDELTMYGHSGVPAPQVTSFQHLMINGAMQPQINYSVQQGCLCLHTENIPPHDSTIILQSVSVLLPPMNPPFFP